MNELQARLNCVTSIHEVVLHRLQCERIPDFGAVRMRKL